MGIYMKNVVIIPTYNEKNNIALIVPAVFKTIPSVHILVVDDNSPDGTARVVKNMQKKYSNLRLLERKKKEGLAPAYIHAFKEIFKDTDKGTIITMDADLSHDPRHLIEMLEKRKTYDVVIGSRYIPGGSTIGWELYRIILSWSGNIYTKTITRMPINDCTGGFNAYNIEKLRVIDFNKINMAGYAFVMHLKYLLHRSGSTFNEIPIIFKNRTNGVSKLSNMIIREGIIAPWLMIFSKK